VAGAAAGFLAPPTDTITLSRVNDQVAGLYGPVRQADAEPTTAQSEAAKAIEHDASDVMKRWDAVKTADLPALNRALRDANLPEIKIESDSYEEEASEDVD
jgi:hypothetical protein